ncbi:exopolysaccharide biosynthesis protein [Dehalococcoidales bacterium]|nr:exopolysaccharide biosynthesis protein [Dehalococcoidales bacterium]
MKKLSLLLEEFITTNPAQIKLGEFVDTISERGIGFLLVVLSLPLASPIPAGGYSLPFALLIILLALQMIMGRSFPLLPHRVRNKAIGSKVVTFIQKRGIPFLRQIERLSKPRLENLGEKNFFRFLGIVILLLALVLLLPIPFTNTIFALAILLIGFGLMNKDGLFILGGGLLGLTATAVVIALLIAGGLALYHL